MPNYSADRIIEFDDLPVLAPFEWQLSRAVLSCTANDPDFTDDASVRRFLLEQLGDKHGIEKAEVLVSHDLIREKGDFDAYVSEMTIQADAPFDPFVVPA